ncbi:MAG: M12 family metallo-peptidase, partial [Phycisphaerae bacterium]
MFSRSQRRVAASVVLALLVCTAVAQQPGAPSVPLAPLVSDAEGTLVGRAVDFGVSGLADGSVMRLTQRPAGLSAHTLYVALPGKKTVRLNLRPISIRDAGYVLREQLADGSWRSVDAGPESTYTGTIAGEPGGYVAASWTVDGLLACVVFSDGQKQWIQPLSDYVPGADAELHVAYRGDDTLCEGFCGNIDLPDSHPPADGYGPRGTCGGAVCVAQLACDADFEYFTARGSSSQATQDRIFAIINVMNHQYVREVQIAHVITTVLVRTAEPDPYSSNVSDTLMCQFITEWTDNQTGVTRDLAKLFTGRDISGSTVGQASNFGQICDNAGFCTAGLDNGAYCYSQSDFSATFACQTDVAAHQIGHLWGAHDC